MGAAGEGSGSCWSVSYLPGSVVRNSGSLLMIISVVAGSGVMRPMLMRQVGSWSLVREAGGKVTR